MAVALLALFMAMGGSAYALVITSGSIKNNTIKSVDVRNHSLLGKDVRSNGIGGGAIKESTLGIVGSALVAHGGARYAVVNAGGQRVRERGTTSSARTAEGRYQVIFAADIRNCGYYATIGGPTASAPPETFRPFCAEISPINSPNSASFTTLPHRSTKFVSPKSWSANACGVAS